MYPLSDWNNLKRGFKFCDTYPPTFPGGLGGKTHLGLDLIVPEGTAVLAPQNGIALKSTGSQGGNIMTLKNASGIIRLLHLSKFGKTGIVKEGDWLGDTGNTGISTGPHLHVDCFVNGRFVDPEIYLKPKMKSIHIQTINGRQFDSIKSQVEYYSHSSLTLSFSNIDHPINGTFNQEQAYKLMDELQINERFCVIFYQGPPESNFAATYWYPDRKMCISTIPLIGNMRVVAYELSHQFQIWLNENDANPRIPVEDIINTPDELIFRKYQTLTPYLNLLVNQEDQATPKKMTKEDVEFLYTILGIEDPDGSGRAFWVGKTLTDFRKAFVPDKIKQLQKLQ